MPLENIPYDASRGEWYPHNDGNYTDRIKSVAYFHSLDYKERLITTNADFTNIIRVDETNVLNNWPIREDVTYFDSTPVYQLFYIIPEGLPDDSPNFTIIINKPTDTGLPNPEDDALYEEYVDDLDNILESNFTGFNFTNIQIGESPDEFYTVPHQTTVSFIETFEENDRIIYTMKLDNPFPITSPQVGSGWNFAGGVVEWNSQYSSEGRSGSFIKLSTPTTVPVGNYIMVGENDTDQDSSLGRYRVTQNLVDENGISCLRVKRCDGQLFANGTFSDVVINDITLRPRLTVRYKVPQDTGGGGETPRAIYKFYNSINQFTGEYNTIRWNSQSMNLASLDHPEIFAGAEPGQGYWVTPSGMGAFNISGSVGLLPLGVNTTTNQESETEPIIRITPWRKAYRLLNRFRPKTIFFRQRSNAGETDILAQVETKDVVSRFFASQSYPSAIPHSPPCVFEEGSVSQRANICIAHKLTLLESSNPDQQAPGSILSHLTGDSTIESELGDGWIFEEGSPDTITFTINREDKTTGPGQSFNGHPGVASPTANAINYDYTGHLSCDGTVIPAYSGEILSFEDDISTIPADNVLRTVIHGFIEEGYTLPGGSVANTAIFIDISETDEVLRWNGSDYTAHEEWRRTFNDLIVRNKTTNETLRFKSFEVLKNEKENYVIVMHTDETFSSGLNHQNEMEIVLENKTAIAYDNPALPTNPVDYSPIEYRSLDTEYIDDQRTGLVEARLSDFTISSDGTVDGNITINYDGDVPDGTQFRLFIQDDEEDTP